MKQGYEEFVTPQALDAKIVPGSAGNGRFPTSTLVPGLAQSSPRKACRRRWSRCDKAAQLRRAVLRQP